MRTRITFLDFKNALNTFSIFSTVDIYKAFPNLHRRRLHEWVARGLLKPVVKRYYVFSDVFIDESFLYFVANRIYDPSYISLQSALSRYGLIPEFVPQVTSVSTKKTTSLSTEFGSFSYFSLKESLMFGYDLVFSKDQKYKIKIAFPEKAILDLLYLNPNIDSMEEFSELRLNTEVYREKVKPDVITHYLELFSSKILTKRVNSLMEYMNNA